MNCPSRVDPLFEEGHNQNPSALNADATTRADMNHVANARRRSDHCIKSKDGPTDKIDSRDLDIAVNGSNGADGLGLKALDGKGVAVVSEKKNGAGSAGSGESSEREGSGGAVGSWHEGVGMRGFSHEVLRVLRKYLKFVGPGFIISVAYIDPGNYATDVAAGASFRFKLLFIVLMSNIFAIFLQSLCIRLGSVTGMNLAENCKAHLPPWLNYVLYAFAESAIIATDIAEVIGTAIALNILLKVPLVAGCAISIIDVLIILIFYRPSGTMKALRAFEFFVMILVLGVVICFAFELSKIKAPIGDVFKGYLPSSTIIQSQALYQSCGILGATVMPHSLYLGSGIVQPRLREYDSTHASPNEPHPSRTSLDDSPAPKYKPSLAAIQACMTYSTVELTLSLFTFALFVNSAILIVAGASLHARPEATDADLFSIHALLARNIAPLAGTLFALALLLSGTSAGIVCTIAGQMVSEGQLNWSLRPWLRRLLTRLISITPSIVIAGAVGRDGLARALQGSQVALSVLLPFVSAPLVWFTCCARYMKVEVPGRDGHGGGAGAGAGDGSKAYVQMRNHWVTTALALLIWGVIVVMNVALLVLVGLGVA